MNKTIGDLMNLLCAPVSEEQKKSVLKEYNYECHYCGKKLTHASAQIDHAIPDSRGGLSIFSNLRAACSQCNLSKGTKTEAEYIEWKRSIILGELGKIVKK